MIEREEYTISQVSNEIFCINQEEAIYKIDEQEYKAIIGKNYYWNEYVEPVSEINKVRILLGEKINIFLKNNKKKYLIIKGDVGLGKTISTIIELIKSKQKIIFLIDEYRNIYDIIENLDKKEFKEYFEKIDYFIFYSFKEYFEKEFNDIYKNNNIIKLLISEIIELTNEYNLETPRIISELKNYVNKENSISSDEKNAIIKIITKIYYKYRLEFDKEKIFSEKFECELLFMTKDKFNSLSFDSNTMKKMNNKFDCCIADENYLLKEEFFELDVKEILTAVDEPLFSRFKTTLSNNTIF